MNWSLLAGGRITRKVNGIPDEYIGDLESLFGNFYGYSKRYSGFMVGVRNSPYSNSNVYNLQFGPGIIDPPGENSSIGQNFVLGPPNKAYEGEPDLFSFSVMGFSGKFMMGNNGKVFVESDDPNVKVDMSQMNTYSATNFCGNDLTSTIKITDGKGNQYIFGGDMSKFELSYPSNDIYFSEGFIGVPVINSFSISKVILANGKTIDFDYYSKDLPYDFCHGPVRAIMNSTYEPLFSIETYFQQGTKTDEWKPCNSPFPYTCIPGGQSLNGSQEFFTLLKKSLLTAIKYDGNEIKINYKSIGYSLKHRYSAPKYLNEWVIDNIETYSNSRLLKSTTFSYDNFGGNFQRPFLRSVKENETNKEYSFEYTGTYNLPPYYTKGIDHWGYWNGNDSNPYLAPYYSTYDKQTGDYDLIDTFRDPSPVFYSATLLNKIIYPTKGSTEFEYEPNDYGQRIERTSAKQFHPSVENKQGTAGGARIYKIKNYSAPGVLSSEKEYRYTKTLYNKAGTISSGILMHWPRYHYYFEFDYGFSKRSLLLTNSSNHQTNSLDSYNVGYSTVFEIENNNGYKEYNFTDYNTNPDNYDFELDGEHYLNTIKFSNIFADEDIQPLNLYRNFQDLYGIDKSVIRGKLNYEKFYKESSNFPQKLIHYDYYDNEMYNNQASDAESNYVTIFHMSGLWAQAYKKFFNSAYLRSKSVINYDDHGNALQWAATEYIYNSPHNNNLSEEKTTFNDNSVVKKTFKYPLDLLIGDPNQPSSFPAEYRFISSMYRKNMLSIPLVTTEYQNNTFLKRSQTLYNFDSNLTIPALPSQELVYSQDKVTNISGVNGTYSVPTISFATQVLSYDQYDSKGNLVQFTDKSGISTTIIWGYNQTQPIAKIEGATYSQVSALASSIVTASDTDAAAAPLSDESSLLNVFDSFRNNAALTSYQVTTYTYDPSIGVRSITPASGIREVYIYDTSYRLKEVRDINGNIIKSYEYHYIP
ncbi:hypothetical protein [Epilithonimonas hungarica]|uniref:hypothetical protein n=1 Tax=Epilithonimonas hungarica TaxID=454006 RepID=UPI0027D7BFA8|nr:hypothetical protein [Epilithonimonas hungarica]